MEWKNPLLLLVGIGISNIGAWVYLIALNLLILDMTNSPLAVSILYILLPIATLCTNFWSGTFIDRFNKRKLMMFLNFIRAIFIFTLSFFESLFLIYIVVFIINIANTIFEPTSMVYMTKLVSKTHRQKFNAFRNFINSCGFILGPSIAGVLFIIGTPNLAIQINSISLIISAIVILLLPNVEIKGKDIVLQRINLTVILNDWKSIFAFSKTNIYVTLVYILFSMLTVFMTALDSLEAAFATEVLSLSNSSYGFLVSIAGGGIIAGSIVNALFANKLKLNILIGFGAFFTPIGYIIFAFSTDFIWASIGFFMLTFCLSFANIGFLTFYQNNVPVDIMGRFSSILGMLEAGFIIVFTLTIGLATKLFDIRSIYIVGSLAFFGLGFMILFIVAVKSKRHYYELV
ncbi:MFS transporter [Niallia circulans]|uniref:MFS transporter n=1 Tax=Niallia circulans TaxID=1397 RepID=A0A553SNB5_NIACI|nr:MFS transporter [Niallia circulans]TRZ38483.1 MFS transporter [Niallia circulans]